MKPKLDQESSACHDHYYAFRSTVGCITRVSLICQSTANYTVSEKKHPRRFRLQLKEGLSDFNNFRQ